MKLKENLLYLISCMKVLLLMALAAAGIMITIGMVNPGACSMEFGTEDRITDLKPGGTEVDFRPETSTPLDLVIGIPGHVAKAPPFHGTLELRAANGDTRIIPFDSSNMSNCRLLKAPSATGFTMPERPEASISGFLKTGQLYRLRVTFEVPPPEGSSLWLQSLDRRSIMTGKHVTLQRSAH
jgi:hypothetical protein